jgi:hypothetical protein
MPGTQLTTIGLFHMSKNCFTDACNQCEDNLNLGTANIAAGLMYLNKALLAELTQMSQDIAALKAEVASLKSKPGLLSSSHASAHTRPIPDSWAR